MSYDPVTDEFIVPTFELPEGREPNINQY
jgi:hypothetical protein